MKLNTKSYQQLKDIFTVVGGGIALFTGYSIYEGNVKFYHNVVMPVFRFLPAETAHRFAVLLANYNMYPRYEKTKYPNLKVKLFGLEFDHPVGVAAGFDKHGEAVLSLFKLGFSFVEVGSVTPLPQPGNDKPRVFRLTEDAAVINRYGFNSDGHDVVYNRLRKINWKNEGIVGVNLGVNKTSEDKIADYVCGVKKFGDISDYLVINVSSPNTPGLRLLQKREVLIEMLTKVLSARDSLSKKTPVLLKISPDESDEGVKNICEIITNNPKCKVDGLIVCNTTVSRPTSLQSSKCNELGGLSGRPLADISTNLIRRIAKLTQGTIPIIGGGGIESGKDAWLKLCAGASLVQLYTSMVYYGPVVAKHVVEGLEQCRLQANSQPQTYPEEDKAH